MIAIKHFFTVILYQPLFNLLIFLTWLIPGHSIGWAIIGLTIIIRLLLLPSSLKTLEHQHRLRSLQPKIDELKDKHKDDKAAHSKAVMELYAAEKVSPFGGCLPMLIQLPVIIVLYQVFLHGLTTTGDDLLYSFTPHLAAINPHWFGLDLLKPERIVIPILAAGLQYYQAWQMMKLAPSPTNKSDDMSQTMSKQMMYFTPVMTYLITLRLPAALGLYWVATTVFMVAQQWWFIRQPTPALSNIIKTKDNVTVTIRAKGSGEGGGE